MQLPTEDEIIDGDIAKLENIQPTSEQLKDKNILVIIGRLIHRWKAEEVKCDKMLKSNPDDVTI